MPAIRRPGFVRSNGPRLGTKKDLIARFDKLMKDNRGGIVDFPLLYIEDYKLNESLEPLRENCRGVVSHQELYKGASLAKVGHLLDTGRDTTIDLNDNERRALDIQRSPKFWNEPKELLLTLFACSLASLTQGWDQAASGNLLWPKEFGLDPYSDARKSRDVWIFGAIQSIPWFSAAILGSYLSDPISEYIGRRGALFFAAACSFTAMIGAAQVNTWQGMFGCRILLGVGIGGKASVVPILESEICPPSKRGRLLVGWQVFVASGLCLGYIATYVFRDNWRHQVLSGAIPAFALLTATWAACESPRWLIIQGFYSRAFETLAERWIFSPKDVIDDPEKESDNPFVPELPRTSYRRRLINHFTFPRIRRAAIAAMIVMLSQQFSGINIIAFLATNFFSTADLRQSSAEDAQLDSYKLAIGWGAVNALASVWAYFLVENKEEPKCNVTDVGSVNEDDERPQFDDDEEEKDLDNLSDLGDAVPHDNEPYTPGYKSHPGAEPYVPGGKTKRMSGASGRVVTFKERPKQKDVGREGDQEGGEANGNKRISTNGYPGKQSHYLNVERQPPGQASGASSILSVPIDDTAESEAADDAQLFDYSDKSLSKFRGRRFLLLTSLGGGAISLFITSLCFMIPRGSSARLPIIALFIMIFTVFYSIGAGAVAFLYCAEVFPNEGREIGMSWSTFWNFFGVGILLLFVPFGINYSHGKLLGIFAGLNVFAFILVFFFVPSTNQTATLEDMSYIFGRKMRHHAKIQWRRLNPRSAVRAPNIQWKTALNERGSVSTMEIGQGGGSVAWNLDDGDGGYVDEIAPDQMGPMDFSSDKYAADTSGPTTRVKDMALGKGKGNPDVIGNC